MLALTLAALTASAWLAARGDVDTIVIMAVDGFVVANAATGLLLTTRRPRHPIGWLLLTSALAYAAGGLAIGYLEASVSSGPRSLPVSPAVAWVGNVAFGLGSGISATFLLLLFPTGHLPSPRWRPVAWLAGVALAALLAGVVLSPSSFEGLPVENPAALDASHPVLLVLEGGGFSLLVAAVVLSVASLVVRYRRAPGPQRQQLKWVAFSALVVGVALAGTAVWEAVNGAASVSDDAENLVTTISLALVPVAIGVAILRHQLFDIDRIISRTISYGAVSALLIGAYVAGVFVFRALLPVEGELPVAVSTLAVAALFNPLRRRVQGLVDRRFNRSRYDAARIIADFGRRVRNQTDLAVLASELVVAAGNTMRPAHVTVWFRRGS